MNNGWKAWLERGQKDLCIAKMFEKTDCEHAAYMTQQALEKHIKAVWIAGNMGQPEDLGHDIVKRLVREIKENSEEFEFSSNTLSKKDAEELMESVEKIIDRMRERPATKAEYWKHSLNIASDKVPESLEKDGNKASEFLEKNQKRGVSILVMCRKVEAKASGYGKMHGLVERAKIKTAVLLSISACTELIINTFPHNTYGRYPTLVEPEKEISTALYARQSDYVGKMLNEAEEVCTCLSVVAENLAKARKK